MKWIHFHFVYGVATDAEVTAIWSEMAVSPTKQQGIAFLYYYLLTGMESCRHDFNGHAQLLDVGGALYKFLVGIRFFNPGNNHTCTTGGFSVWMGLQEVKDMGAAIAASNADMAALNG